MDLSVKERDRISVLRRVSVGVSDARGGGGAAGQEGLFIAASAVGALDKLLRRSGFDEFAEETCRSSMRNGWAGRAFLRACTSQC